MTDALFADPRLALLYDVIDGDRSDLDAYVAIASELGAASVLDVGCGTGTLACRLAASGFRVTAIDPAAASLEIAEHKPGASNVAWLHGSAGETPALGVDLAVMTGNVAQVFTDDHDWHRTLTALHRAVRPGGWLVFETRDPDQQAWHRWTKQATHRRLHTDRTGVFETWTELISVDEPLVTFQHVFVFERDGSTLTSTSTLRFRHLTEIETALRRAGFELHEVRDAPDRPGLEFVVLARRRTLFSLLARRALSVQRQRSGRRTSYVLTQNARSERAAERPAVSNGSGDRWAPRDGAVRARSADLAGRRLTGGVT